MNLVTKIEGFTEKRNLSTDGYLVRLNEYGTVWLTDSKYREVGDEKKWMANVDMFVKSKNCEFKIRSNGINPNITLNRLLKETIKTLKELKYENV